MRIPLRSGNLEVARLLWMSPSVALFKNENSFEEWKPVIASFTFSVSPFSTGLKMRIPLRSGNFKNSLIHFMAHTMFKNENSFEEWKL